MLQGGWILLPLWGPESVAKRSNTWQKDPTSGKKIQCQAKRVWDPRMNLFFIETDLSVSKFAFWARFSIKKDEICDSLLSYKILYSHLWMKTFLKRVVSQNSLILRFIVCDFVVFLNRPAREKTLCERGRCYIFVTLALKVA